MQLFINTCLFASANCFGSWLTENPPSESLFPLFVKVNNAIKVGMFRSTIVAAQYWTGLDIGCVPAGPHAFFRSSGHNNSFYAGPRGQWLSDRWQTHAPLFSVDVCRRTMVWLPSIFIHIVILPVRTSIKTWLTNNIRHVTKLLMPKLNN